MLQLVEVRMSSDGVEIASVRPRHYGQLFEPLNCGRELRQKRIFMALKWNALTRYEFGPMQPLHLLLPNAQSP